METVGRIEDRSIQPREILFTRLNPVCPVCGEDEPRMEVWKRNEKPLVCFCHRCGFQWDVEPLSKPWED